MFLEGRNKSVVSLEDRRVDFSLVSLKGQISKKGEYYRNIQSRVLQFYIEFSALLATSVIKLKGGLRDRISFS